METVVFLFQAGSVPAFLMGLIHRLFRDYGRKAATGEVRVTGKEARTRRGVSLYGKRGEAPSAVCIAVFDVRGIVRRLAADGLLHTGIEEGKAGPLAYRGGRAPELE